MAGFAAAECYVGRNLLCARLRPVGWRIRNYYNSDHQSNTGHKGEQEVTKRNVFISGVAIATIALASCSSDKKVESPTSAKITAAGATPAPETTPVAETTPVEPTTPVAPTDPPEASSLDTNGDGKVVFGIAAAGPADDGAYYQAVVDAAKELSTENGFEDPIVVDNIQAADAATAMADLAQQGVDVIIVGASEIAEPLPALIDQYPDIFWYCNCGAGFKPNPGLAQSTDDGGEIGFTAGYATGLKLQESGGDSVVFIGCCDLDFEKQAYLSFELGLQTIDPAFTMTYVPTGDFPYDFDNSANATAALQTAVDNGADAVYPYLGGAHRPVVQAANEAGLITMSAGSSTVCDAGEELDYAIAVRFDGGDYVRAVIGSIIDGSFTEGSTKQFKVGVDPEPGAMICDATEEEQAAMDDIYTRISGGEFAEALGAIAGKAFGG
jgi:basic membrane protein A and related proteins